MKRLSFRYCLPPIDSVSTLYCCLLTVKNILHFFLSMEDYHRPCTIRETSPVVAGLNPAGLRPICGEWRHFRVPEAPSLQITLIVGGFGRPAPGGAAPQTRPQEISAEIRGNKKRGLKPHRGRAPGTGKCGFRPFTLRLGGIRPYIAVSVLEDAVSETTS